VVLTLSRSEGRIVPRSCFVLEAGRRPATVCATACSVRLRSMGLLGYMRAKLGYMRVKTLRQLRTETYYSVQYVVVTAGSQEGRKNAPSVRWRRIFGRTSVGKFKKVENRRVLDPR
jgi:hypothetical protein